MTVTAAKTAYSPLKVLHHPAQLASAGGGAVAPPVHVQLIISDLCNHNCSFCAHRMDGYINNETFSKGVRLAAKGTNNPVRMIPLGKCEEIIDDAAEMGVRAIQISGGGEPTVHPHHVHIFERVLDRGMDLALVTNGQILKGRAVEHLQRATWVQVSVDAGRAETYARIREVSAAVFDRVWENICREFGVERYTYLKSAKWRGMSVAANAAYKQARGDVLILQQADVLHASPDAIERLAAVEQGTARIADVWDYDPATRKRLSLYTGKARPRGLFFLGSVHRQAVYAVGGMDEDFREAGYDDVWFYRCLLENGIAFRYPGDIVGYHQSHNRPKRIYGIPGGKRRMKKLLHRKVAAAEAGEIPWRSPNGPWGPP